MPPAGAEVACQISLELDGHEKTVVQLRKGDQSRELTDLARTLLEISRPLTRQGITPSGLEDALARVATGELAPELLSLSIQRKPLAGQERGGWRLAVRRQHLETRPFTVGAGWGEARRIGLDAGDVRALAGLLARHGFSSMPVNLWSEVYTDVDVAVMRWRKSVQARQFDGLAPDDLGDQQRAFELLLESLAELRLRTLDEAQRASG